MISKILKEIKEKKKGIVVVHNKLAVFLDLSDKNNLTYDSLAEKDFDNYLLSFGFLKNLKVSVDILTDNLTAVVIVGDQTHPYEEFDRLAYLLKILHLKGFNDNYLANLIGINLKDHKSKTSIDKSLSDKGKIIFPSIDLEYKKILKVYPHFNSNKIQITGAMLVAIILVASVTVISIPDIHAQLIIEISEVLTENGYPNRAFELCNAADFFKSTKIYEECKLKFLPNLADPIQALPSFEGISDKQLAEDLLAAGNNLHEKNASVDPRIVLMYFETSLALAQNSLEPDFDEKSKKDIEKKSRNGIANVWVETDPNRAISKFKKSLDRFEKDNTDAQIGIYFTTQVIADSQKKTEPDEAKKNYNEVLDGGVNLVNELIESKSARFTSLQIDCYTDLDIANLEKTVGFIGLENKLNDDLVNILRVIANTCYGLMTLEDDTDYAQIHKSVTMKIFEKILSDRPSDVKTLMSKAKILSDVVKSNFFKNNDNDNLDKTIDLYESVLAEEPNNKIALKDLVLLYHLQGNEKKKQDTLDKLKNDNNKGDALIKGILFFTESKECNNAENFYKIAEKILDDKSVLATLKQKLDDKCPVFSVPN